MSQPSLAVAAKPMTCLTPRQRARIDATFCACPDVDTNATTAPESLSRIRELLGRQRRIDRDVHEAAP